MALPRLAAGSFDAQECQRLGTVAKRMLPELQSQMAQSLGLLSDQARSALGRNAAQKNVCDPLAAYGIFVR